MRSKKKVMIKQPRSQSRKGRREKPGEFHYYKFNQNETIEEIRARVRSTRRIPGSPLLTIIPLHTEQITDTVLCPHDEIVRRRLLTESRVYMKLYYNEKEIMQTSVNEINGQKFSVEWTGQERPTNGTMESTISLHDPSMQDLSSGGGMIKSTLISVLVNQEPESIKAEIFEVVSGHIDILGCIRRYSGG